MTNARIICSWIDSDLCSLVLVAILELFKLDHVTAVVTKRDLLGELTFPCLRGENVHNFAWHVVAAFITKSFPIEYDPMTLRSHGHIIHTDDRLICRQNKK